MSDTTTPPSNNNPALKVLNGKNYRIWAMRVKSELQTAGLWHTIHVPTGKGIKVESATEAQRTKAFNIILRAVSDTYACTIIDFQDRPDEAWDALKCRCQWWSFQPTCGPSCST